MEKTSCQSASNSPHSCASCTQRKQTLFRGLSSIELESLNSERYTLNYKEGEIIYKAGMKPIGLLCIHEGNVKIIRTGPAGNDQIIGLSKGGDFIGLKALIKKEMYANSAVALSSCSVCIIPDYIFSPVMQKNPEFCLQILNHFLDKLESSEQLHINHAQKHMRARLADALIQIQEVYGQNPKTGYLNVKLKRAEIASLSNMTPANAIRILSAFSTEKLIELNKREIRLINTPALKFLSVSGR